jgi:hypothetical protein
VGQATREQGVCLACAWQPPAALVGSELIGEGTKQDHAKCVTRMMHCDGVVLEEFTAGDPRATRAFQEEGRKKSKVPATTSD